MGEKHLVISIVVLTVIFMLIFCYRTYKNENYCSKCKKHKSNKKL